MIGSVVSNARRLDSQGPLRSTQASLASRGEHALCNGWVAATRETFRVSGAEHIPASGPAIFCPNHTSVIDSFMLPLVLPRRISYVGKAEYMDSWKTKYIFPAMGMIPIDRAGGDKSQSALDTAAGVLRRGELFGIFPEGTRSRDGLLHKGRTGAARLALEIGCPIYPVGIVGTDAIQPPGAKAPKLFKRCSITIGRPIRPERYRDRRESHLACRSMIDEVMFEIRDMTGQTYKNVYAGQPETEDATPAKVATVADESPSDERELASIAS